MAMAMAMTEHASATMIARHDRELFCECGRYIGRRSYYGDLPAHTLWVRVRCGSCLRWKWFDLVSGDVVDHPRPRG